MKYFILLFIFINGCIVYGLPSTPNPEDIHEDQWFENNITLDAGTDSK